MLKVIRSPSKVAWHVVYTMNGRVVEVKSTRREAIAVMTKMESQLRGWKI